MKFRSTSLAKVFTYLTTNILVAGLPFMLVPFLTRTLTQEEYGEVAMYNAFLSACAALTGLNTAGAASRRYFDSKISREELRRFITSCIGIGLISAGALFLIVLVFQNWLSAVVSLDLRYLLLAVLAALANFFITLRLGQWHVEGKSGRFGLMQVGRSVLNVGATIVFVFVLYLGAAGRIYAQVGTMIVVAIVGVFLLRKDRLLGVKGSVEDMYSALKFGIPLIPHVAGIFVLSMLDRFIIANELGLSEAGMFAVAAQLALGCYLVTDAINRVYSPWLFRALGKDDRAEKSSIVVKTYAYFIVVAVLAVPLVVFSEELLVLIAGEKYAPAGPALRVLFISQVFSAYYLMVVNYLFYARKTGSVSLATTIAVLVHVSLLVLLVPRMGIYGAAMAGAVSAAIRFIVMWIFAGKAVQMPWLGVLLSRKAI